MAKIYFSLNCVYDMVGSSAKCRGGVLVLGGLVELGLVKGVGGQTFGWPRVRVDSSLSRTELID